MRMFVIVDSLGMYVDRPSSNFAATPAVIGYSDSLPHALFFHSEDTARKVIEAHGLDTANVGRVNFDLQVIA